MLLQFEYKTKLVFTEPVSDQYFSFLCLPVETERQHVIKSSCRVLPGTVLHEDTDGAGNPMVYGVVRPEHAEFELTAGGLVETAPALYEAYEAPDGVGLHKYRAASPHTVPGPGILGLRQAWAAKVPEGPYDRLLYYSDRVREALRYEPGVTGTDTTAEEAAGLGAGVCQDFAHLLIALLRLEGVPARYVTGLMQGEGESHAWVEANCGGYWYGIDPTNGLLVNESYVKFAHGRDYADCMISRGIFRNPRAEQHAEVTANVTLADSRTAFADDIIGTSS